MNAVTIIEAAPVFWRSLDTIPEDRKDGRDVLLWLDAGYPVLCAWDGVWCDAVGHPVAGATKWADVEGPAK